MTLHFSFTLLTASLILSGCAVDLTPPTLPPGHPANPQSDTSVSIPSRYLQTHRLSAEPRSEPASSETHPSSMKMETMDHSMPGMKGM